MNPWTKLLFTTYPFLDGFIHVDLKIYDKDDGVVLVQGLNIYGKRIYVYLKLDTFFFVEAMQKLAKKEKFDLREYGEVVTAGIGEPPLIEHKKLARQYDMLPYEKKKG